MNGDYLAHHGIIGMKWGIRRYQNADGSLTSTGRKRRSMIYDENANNATKKKNTEKKLKDMTDDELKIRITRLELEKRFKDLSKPADVEKTSRGKKIVMDILEKSGSNIATQLTTYAMGTAVNKMIGSEIVNPRKGQKDK